MDYQMSPGFLSQDPATDLASENLTWSIINSIDNLGYIPAYYRNSIAQALNRTEQRSETGVLWNHTYSPMQQVAQPNPPFTVWNPARPQQFNGMFQEVDSILQVNQYLPQAVSQPVWHPGAASNINDLGRQNPRPTVPPSSVGTAYDDGMWRNSTQDRQPIAHSVLAQQGYSDQPFSSNSRASFSNRPGTTASSLATNFARNSPIPSNASTRTTGTDLQWFCQTPSCRVTFGRERDFTNHQATCGTNSVVKCSYCNTELREEKSRKRHERDQHHVCHNCNAPDPQSGSGPELEGHVGLPLRFSSAVALERHDAKCHKVDCGYCEEVFASARDRNIHHADVHGKGIQCGLENCDAVRATQGDLENHYQWGHNLKPQWRCHSCGKRYWTEKKLREHTCRGRPQPPSDPVDNPR